MTTDKERKQSPVYSGFLRYFPDACIAVSQCSYLANEQHNPGEPMHWARDKSPDELDSMMRHALHAGEMDTDGIRHSTKVAWRAMANLQKEIEAENVNTSPQVDVRQPIMDEEDARRSDLVGLEEAFNLAAHMTEKPEAHAVGLGDIEYQIEAAQAERQTIHPLHTK